MSIERRTIGVMFTASAFSVANPVYCQPLLSDIGRSLGVSDSAIGYLPMWTQAGTALGMFAFVPLGDMFPRRRLIVIMSGATAATASMMALAPNLTLVNAAGFALGLTGIGSHLIRTDFIISDKGPVYLETNTLPGLTKASLYPKALKAQGIAFVDFLRDQIELAAKRAHK